MARKVKCTICKLEGTNETFIAVPKQPKGNYYFCSQEHINEHEYNELEKRKAKWILDYIAKLIKYDETKLFPNSIRKELNKLRSMYEYDVIYKCLCDGASTIEWKANNGGWSTEWGMTRYIFSIIESKLNDTVSEFEAKGKSEMKADISVNKLIESNSITDIEEVIYKTKENKKDISSFLEDEDL